MDAATASAVEQAESVRRPGGYVVEAPLDDASALVEDVEIEREKRERILSVFRQLDGLTHYALLGVGSEAEKKAIKSAYYALAPEFHPDKYFRKRLGSYKTKIEAIFMRLTLAYDVLTSRQRRVEYDEYLILIRANQTMEAVLEQTPSQIASLQRALEEEAALAAAAAMEAVVAEPPPLPGQRAPWPGASPSPAADPRSAEHLRARRAALARKLAGGRRITPAAPEPNIIDDPRVASQMAMESLRARYQPLLADPRKVQLNRYLDNGRAALDRKDFAAAANAYRIAASLAPEDAHVQATCEEAVRLADEALADGYWKQAQYEEGQGAWAEAAVSYARACAGRPNDAAAHERVAFATLKASANTRRAVEFARRAVELSPTTPELRVTLARAYAAAGFEKSAKSELDRAQELAPKDAKIRELVAQVRQLAKKPQN